MKIYFNGDSHTSGSELEYPLEETYSYQLAKLLNAEVIENPAVGGGSNDRILRTTENFLYRCDTKNEYPDLIVIGWSEFTRVDWYHSGAYRSVGAADDQLSHEKAFDIDPKRHEYTTKILAGGNDAAAMTRYYHNKIYNLHCDLTDRKIPHLFFSGVISFDSSLELYRSKLPKFYYDWNNCYWNPYSINGSFLEYGLSLGFKETEYHHLDKEAHKLFANILREYLYSNSIIS